MYLDKYIHNTFTYGVTETDDADDPESIWSSDSEDKDQKRSAKAAC